MKYLLLFFAICSVRSNAQPTEIPKVAFNHLFFVLRNEDLAAIQQSEFIKNKLAAFEMRTTKVSDETWSGTYLYGTDTYAEFFDTTAVTDSPLGSAAVGFSVDRLRDFDSLRTALSKEFSVDTNHRAKDYDGKQIPWFYGLFINDSLFYQQSFLGFWVMAYDTAYFNYNKIFYKDDMLTRKNYLQKFEEERKGKILKNFNGAILNLAKIEKEYFTKLLLNLGFSRSGVSTFTSADSSFTFILNDRSGTNPFVLSALLFETNSFAGKQVIKISDHVSVLLMENKGQIIFK